MSRKFIGFKEKVFAINNLNPINNSEPFSGCLESDLMSKDFFFFAHPLNLSPNNSIFAYEFTSAIKQKKAEWTVCSHIRRSDCNSRVRANLAPGKG